jgi:hypothetical protein
MGIDWLHCLSLGVFQVYLGHLVWELLLANAWGMSGTAVNKFELGLVAMKAELWAWYSTESAQGRDWTRIQGLTTGMLGATEDRGLKLHGSETNGFLVFSSTLLEKYGFTLGVRAQHHDRALKGLVGIYKMIKAHPAGNLADDDIEQCCSWVLEHMQSLRALGVATKPKHHMLLEFGARCSASPHNCSYRLS